MSGTWDEDNEKWVCECGSRYWEIRITGEAIIILNKNYEITELELYDDPNYEALGAPYCLECARPL